MAASLARQLSCVSALSSITPVSPTHNLTAMTKKLDWLHSAPYEKYQRVKRSQCHIFRWMYSDHLTATVGRIFWGENLGCTAYSATAHDACLSKCELPDERKYQGYSRCTCMQLLAHEATGEPRAAGSSLCLALCTPRRIGIVQHIVAVQILPLIRLWIHHERSRHHHLVAVLEQFSLRDHLTFWTSASLQPQLCGGARRAVSFVK